MCLHTTNRTSQAGIWFISHDQNYSMPQGWHCFVETFYQYHFLETELK